ncbi:MAG: hypothetical protein ACYCST_05850 [Acidimicrobiales bacterium]
MSAPGQRTANSKSRSRQRGSGGIFEVRDDVWRVDVEVHRATVTGRRRRVSRYVHGTRDDAEIALARLKLADHERRLPTGGTSARSVRSCFQLYLQSVESGLIELASRTVVATRSAANAMSTTELSDGRLFGDVRLSRLTWQDVELCYAAMRAGGRWPGTGLGKAVCDRSQPGARRGDADPAACSVRVSHARRGGSCPGRRARRRGP